MPNLNQVYASGSSSADQTMHVAANKGGPVAIKAAVALVGSLLSAATSVGSKIFEVIDAAIPRVNLAGMFAQNDPVFGSPVMGSQTPNDYASYTADGNGPLWGGTGMTCRQQPPGGPEISSVVLTVDDEIVAGASPGVFLVNKLGAGAAPTIPIVDGVVTPDPSFGAVSFVGAGTIDTITADNQSYWVEFIPTDTFNWTTNGNIALAGTAQVGRLLRFWHDNRTNLWYPSYT